MQSCWVDACWQVLRHGKARLDSVVDLWIDVHHLVNEAPLPFLLLFFCQLNKVDWRNHLLWVLFDNLNKWGEELSVTWQVNNLLHLFLIEVTFVTFFLEIRVDYLAPD